MEVIGHQAVCEEVDWIPLTGFAQNQKTGLILHVRLE